MGGGTTEATTGTGPIDERALSGAITKSLREISAPETASAAQDDSDTARTLVASRVLALARTALNAAPSDSATAKLTEDEVSALELIVRTVGRPALRFKNGHVDMPANRLGDNSRWYVLIAVARDKIGAVAGGVCRISCEQRASPLVLGTGWRAGNDLVVTNRHVAMRFVVDRNAPCAEWKIDAAKVPFADFSFDDGNADVAHVPIVELVYCADKDDVDIAVLRVAPAAAALPRAAVIDWDESALGRMLPPQGQTPPVFQGGEIYTVGHPWHRQATAPTRTVFGDADGRKRCSPGLITGVDSNLPILLHDCSTLGGNSGSCVVSTESKDHAVVGLHFGGNEAGAPLGSGLGSANYAIAFARLKNHPVAELLGARP